MSKIFDKDSDSDVELKTDNEYAKNYDRWRKKEELNRLKTKYGEELLDETSSSSSDDDDEGVELTEEVEKQFFKTLSCLKNKDPRIYDENVKFFDDVEENEQKNTKKLKKEKPMYINDYERELILKKKGELSDSDEVEEDPRSKSPTYVEEQSNMKESFKTALNKIAEDDDDSEWGGMLKVRNKTEEEKFKEEVEYKEWLAGHKNEIGNKEVESELKPLKDYWSNPQLDEGEKFLRDYVLNKRFLNKEDDDYIPTYEEIIHDSDKDLSEDEDAIEKQEEFEHKFNFRFEEPDQDFIKRYPRTLEQSLRKTDDRRKLKRSETKERKQKEKEQKMQELKTLQELKKKEIEEKIEKLKEITGNDDIQFKDEDLDGDFDPEAHDKKMESLFNEEFYDGTEGDQKPEFPELDEYLEIENWEKWKGDNETEEGGDFGEGYAPHCEDEDFNMDCDYDPKTELKKELIENSKGKKKRKRKSLFAKAVSQSKPVFDPSDKTYEEYLEEYYKLDCEDIIGNIPCRFKYRKVVPNSFGLTIEEILTANDRELNKWCSLKKAVQHRPDSMEKYDQIAYEKKAKNVDLKRRILPSLFISVKDDEDTKEEESNRQKKKKVKKVRCKKGVNVKEEKEIKGEEIETDEKLEDNSQVNIEKKIKEEMSESLEEKKEVINGEVPKLKASKKKKKKKAQNKNSSISENGKVENNDQVKTPKKIEKKISESLEKKKQINNAEVAKATKHKKKKKKAHNKNSSISENGKVATKKRKLSVNSNSDVPNKQAKTSFKGKKQKLGISDARLSAYGINPKKFKNKMKYGKS